MPIRAVIFDFGNVLCCMPGPEDFEPLYRLSGIDGAHFQEVFWRHRLDYDRGTLDGLAYWRTIAQDAGAEFTQDQIERLVAGDIALWQRLNPSLCAWVPRLREARLKTAVLSNMPLDLARHLRQRADWMKQFDHAVFSAELRLLKPQPEIYAASLDGLRVRPEEALFIDDNAANVEGARKAGLQALQFESVCRLGQEIAPFGLPALPDA